MRVYGARKKKKKNNVVELAVLKWHRVGVYAVGFGDVGVGGDGSGQEGMGDGLGGGERGGEEGDEEGGKEGDEFGGAMTTMILSKKTTVAGSREERTKKTRWLAAGGKDGKISLWDIY